MAGKGTSAKIAVVRVSVSTDASEHIARSVGEQEFVNTGVIATCARSAKAVQSVSMGVGVSIARSAGVKGSVRMAEDASSVWSVEEARSARMAGRDIIAEIAMVRDFVSTDGTVLIVRTVGGVEYVTMGATGRCANNVEEGNL
uniref:Uncharacterized protein n=1 Tax=Chromera velia CCMP2878 TaxID=1169474 RepID=A0A0G4HRG5_9ALVE|eukprot:Cvel_1280.t1-p1 / transcript=Cvel_1280.t1 / gene=Cvel_1280 / organism=Chromera_velia_CCMP2878 / gene_product=Zinc finger protein 571, putative / transcript_product=Zinc finger protein 571, putative / location=Cvel_scaffold43:37334-37759(-) / protein_length=142 / sequence_SO=supercontig / SO=protein_coding / is_pseudo=false